MSQQESVRPREGRAVRRQRLSRASQRRRGVSYDEAGRPHGPPSPGVLSRVIRLLGA